MFETGYLPRPFLFLNRKSKDVRVVEFNTEKLSRTHTRGSNKTDTSPMDRSSRLKIA